jgi:hypothetical protein
MKSLLPLLLALAATPAFAAAPNVPLTDAHRAAAGFALIGARIVTDGVEICATLPAPQGTEARAAVAAWGERNLPTALAARRWMDYAAQAMGGGDAAKALAFRKDMDAKIAAAAGATLQKLLPGMQKQVTGCDTLTAMIAAGKFDLMGNPQHAPRLREIAAVDFEALRAKPAAAPAAN